MSDELKKDDARDAPNVVEPSSLEEALRERLRAIKSVTERRTLEGVAREIVELPVDVARVAVEVGAALESVSVRASVNFLRAFSEAAQVLDAESLRAWGEMGRRLAMADAETGAAFFAAGVEELKDVPRAARHVLFEVCERQMSLSTSIALETFRRAPEVARAVGDDGELLRSIYEVALEIARRSAKHSADFLAATPHTLARLSTVRADTTTRNERDDTDAVERDAHVSVTHEAVRLASDFALRAFGIASDMWAALPGAVEELDEAQALHLFQHARDFLGRGGAAALHTLTAGGEALRLVPDAFDEWANLLQVMAGHSNAVLVALARTSPSFFRALVDGRTARARVTELARRVIAATCEVARVDAEAAICCLRAAPRALHATSIEGFERWAQAGLSDADTTPRARRSFYALETGRSLELLQSASAGLALEDVAQTLRFYVEGLTGREVEVAPLAAVPDEARINDGRTIHLPASVSEFGDAESDFRLYKVLAAHAAGQIEFGTQARATHDLRAAYTALAEIYAPESMNEFDLPARDDDTSEVTRATLSRDASPEEATGEQTTTRRALPPDGDYRAALALFPQSGLATRLFGTLENGRIDRQLRHTYRGLARDLDFVRAHLRESRPRVSSLPLTLVPFELLFQITLCGGALDDARSFYGQIVSELETIVLDYVSGDDATVADTLMATSRVYALFQAVVPEMAERQRQNTHENDEQSEQSSGAQSNLAREKDEESDDAERAQAERERQRDARELFNAWAGAESGESDGDQIFTGAERWMTGDQSEQELEAGEVAFAYDEWDRELNDTRVGWCRVVEKRVKKGERTFVELTRTRYRGVISSIRHQFQLMKPENLKRVLNELDGDDYDLNALVDYVIDRRADGHQSERIYTKRLRRERDVAVSFLLDQSSSTARTIGRHPLQPYTHPGRRIIEVEKEGLVLMCEALESVGDSYSIYGFTSEGRRNVKFYVVKDFDERYNDEVERKIGGINYQNNTRLGAAIRHAAARLRRRDARTRLLIVLSDGRPYDHDYGDARYAREDTREALKQARTNGIIPFCITIDRDSEVELRDLYGDVGYTIIDDVLSLPERMPAIYRRLTT